MAKELLAMFGEDPGEDLKEWLGQVNDAVVALTAAVERNEALARAREREARLEAEKQKRLALDRSQSSDTEDLTSSASEAEGDRPTGGTGSAGSGTDGGAQVGARRASSLNIHHRGSGSVLTGRSRKISAEKQKQRDGRRTSRLRRGGRGRDRNSSSDGLGGGMLASLLREATAPGSGGGDGGGGDFMTNARNKINNIRRDVGGEDDASSDNWSDDE